MEPSNFAKIYSLAAAASRTNVTPNEILRAAANGKLKLIVAIPPGAPLCLLCVTGSSKEYGAQAPMRSPNFLLLEGQHCHSLNLTGRATLRESRMGYVYDADEEFRELHPADCGDDLPVAASEIPYNDIRRRWNSWAIHDPVHNTPLNFVTEDVSVTDAELERHFFGPVPLPGNVGGNFKSEYLQALNRAALIFWGNEKVAQEDKTTHPKTSAIVDWLVNMGFSRTLAKNGASIIRPEFAESGRPLDF